jgi:hypothetical protein
MTNSPLLPERHPESDLFICDIADAVIKSDMASMEHPIFVLTKQPYMKTRRYENGENWFEVAPSSIGIANIYDKDILIFAISQIMAAKNSGRPYSKEILFTAYDFLVYSNRGTGGKDYESLKDSLTRLQGTSLRTNIKTGDEGVWKTFGLVESAMIKQASLDGRVLEWGITLSDWLFNAIESNEVLTLHRDYFRLRKPLERRLYEIARKHCGMQNEWRIGIELLQKKCGSTSNKRHFKHMLKNIAEHQHLPDYAVVVIDDTALFTRKQEKSTQPQIPDLFGSVLLQTSTYEKFRKKFPNYDPYFVEQEWKNWISGKKPPNNPDAAFLGFAKIYVENHPL